jgi:hypothetical protein
VTLQRDRNGRNSLRWMLSGTSQIRLGSFICLVALLAQLYLPLVHQCAHILEGLNASAALGVEQKAEFSLEAAESHHPHHSHHDAATCPICQAALGCRYFAAPTLSLSSILVLPVQRCCDNAFASIVANPHILISGPRSPPTSL